MLKDKISVIIPTYKLDNNYFKKCLESICNQTYKLLEIIIVNDGMTEANLRLVNQYIEKDSRIKIIGDKNQGVSSARNKGIEYASGRWIAFIDADDYVENDYCERMLNVALKENAQCVICSYKRIYKNKEEVILKEKSFSMNSDEIFNKIFMVQSGFGFASMKLWDAEIVKKSNIRFNEQLKVAEDALFSMQMSEKIEKVYYLNEALYNYRFNEQSAVRKFDKNYTYKYLLAMQKTKEYIQKTDENNIVKLYNYIVYHVLLIIVNYCFHPKNDTKGIKSLKEVCKISEFEEAIRKSNYDGFSITRKITLFTIKYKLYFLTSIIAKIRQAQFDK